MYYLYLKDSTFLGQLFIRNQSMGSFSLENSINFSESIFKVKFYQNQEWNSKSDRKRKLLLNKVQHALKHTQEFFEYALWCDTNKVLSVCYDIK